MSLPLDDPTISTSAVLLFIACDSLEHKFTLFDANHDFRCGRINSRTHAKCDGSRNGKSLRKLVSALHLMCQCDIG